MAEFYSSLTCTMVKLLIIYIYYNKLPLTRKKGENMKILVVLALGVSLLLSALDINTAGKSELMALRGIGPKKADAIISYRIKHCFKTVDSITKVKGIGLKTLEKNRADLKVGKCKK